MDMGFQPELAATAGAAAVVAKWILYPAVGLRRHRDGDEDDATGRHLIPRRLHTPLVFVLCAAGGAVFATLSGEPVLPAMSSTLVGLVAAHTWHDATKRKEA